MKSSGHPTRALSVCASLLWTGVFLLVLAPLQASARTGRGSGSSARFVGSILAGAATAIVPLAVGGSLLAQSESQKIRHGGLYLVEAGLAAAPLVSHLVAGEYNRGVAFTLPPLLCAMSMRALVGYHPDIVEEATTESRVAFFAILSLSVTASAIGLLDSLFARERAARKLHLVPQAGPSYGGLIFGGSL